MTTSSQTPDPLDAQRDERHSDDRGEDRGGRTTGDPLLDRLIHCLPPDLPPERDLWPEIESQLHQPVRWPAWRSVKPTVTALALAAGLAAAVLGLGWLWRSASAPPEAASVAAAGAEAGGASTAAEAEDGYRVPAADAFDRSLVAALERRRLELGPETASAVESDIARLGGAVSDLLMALASNPDDPVLYRHLAARQHQQAQLLNRLSRL